jgi:hypothetical protein
MFMLLSTQLWVDNATVYTRHRISCGTRDNFINFVQRRTKIQPVNVNISRVAVMWRYITAFRFFSHWIPFRSIERRQLCAKPLVNLGWHAQVKWSCMKYWATGADSTLLASWLSPLWCLHVSVAVILWSHKTSNRSNSYLESAHPHWLLFFLSISFYVTSTPSLRLYPYVLTSLHIFPSPVTESRTLLPPHKMSTDVSEAVRTSETSV